MVVQLKLREPRIRRATCSVHLRQNATSLRHAAESVRISGIRMVLPWIFQLSKNEQRTVDRKSPFISAAAGTHHFSRADDFKSTGQDVHFHSVLNSQ